jgi:transcriptional regulator with XRE-family HTH domain
MNSLWLEQKTPAEIAGDVALAMRKRRKERGFTQAELARRSGVSLGSLKRFESQNEIALASLIRIAVALGCEDDFEGLFSRRQYRSIQEVIDAQR